MTSQLKYTTFEPWVGKYYRDRLPFGIPVMILGESHYSSETPEGRSLTNKVFKGVVEGKYDFNFSRNVAAAFLGPANDAEHAKDFWNSVVLYNFVQKLVKRGEKKNIDRQTWLDAEFPFLEVFMSLDPHPGLIAVFGCETWGNTPCCGQEVPSISIGSEQYECYEFCLGGKKSLAPKIHHASRGFSPGQWHPVILKALERAGGHEYRA